MSKNPEAQECITPWGLSPLPVLKGVINSVREARQVLAHHSKEQRYEGGLTSPYMWMTFSEPHTLVVTVYSTEKGYVSMRPYQYTITADYEEVTALVDAVIHPEPKPEKERAPRLPKISESHTPKQLHMFNRE